jgi:hypothetical protein
MAKKYTYRQDPGHGWVQVSLFELQTLGVADKISSYSYQDGGTCYLEEDCDAEKWMQAYKSQHGDYPAIQDVVYPKDCFIRKLPRYKKP